ncbi:unnamed protein product [Alopecurus aequalis]
MAEVNISSLAISALEKAASFGTDWAVNEIKSAWKVKKELRKLERSLRSICAVLRDAEDRQSTSHGLQEWLDNLKDAVYDIDDVLDYVSTQALEQEVHKGFFTGLSHLLVYPFKLSHKIKEVRIKLDEIAANRAQFGLTQQPIDGQLFRRGNRETHSFIAEPDIIGRTEAKKEIVERILTAKDSKNHLSVLPIVGLGGIGKTALAKWVYNDGQVTQNFEKKFWVCVSDVFDLKKILDDMIQLDTGANNMKMSQKDHAIVSSEKVTVSESVRHLVWDREDFSIGLKFPKQLRKACKTRTFTVRASFGTVCKSFLEDLFSSFTLLRAVTFFGVDFELVPSSIGDLKHLRYLLIQFNAKLRILPKSLGKLVNLEMLLLYGCEQLEDLPNEAHNLVSLVYLNLTSKQKSLFKDGLCGWSSLVNLRMSYCYELTSLEEGFDSLTALRELLIYDCPKLAALPSSIWHLSTLVALRISNCEDLDLMVPGEALGRLHNLQNLQLGSLPKLVRLPETFKSAASSVQYIQIVNCENLERLPNYIQDFRSLKKAMIYN